MATIGTAIELTDAITAPLTHITSALNLTISAFEDMQSACDNAFDSSNFEAARSEIEAATIQINEMEVALQEADRRQRQLNEDMQRGVGVAADLGDKIKGFVAAFVGISAVKKSINWISDSLAMTDVQTNAETQLQVVLQNIGADSALQELEEQVASIENEVIQGHLEFDLTTNNLDLTDIQRSAEIQLNAIQNDVIATDTALQRLKTTASNIQGYTVYGDEAMLGAAAEFATYLNDVEAIESMMGTLANYAAGMSGGGEVSYQQMVDYATQLGKVLEGSYDGITKKGFVLSDAQREIIENGSDMERALVIDEVISESWANLAEQMANTPQGQLIQMKNSFGDIREEIGSRLYPAVLSLFQTINARMPEIESILMGFAGAVQIIIFAIEGVIEAATIAYDFIADNWSIIAPIVFGIATAFAVYNGILLVHNGILAVTAMWKGLMALKEAAHAAALAMSTGATFAATAAQYGLNAALLACPITWILIIIIAIIAAVYAAVAAVNKFAGTSVSATGIICGAFMVALAFIGNIFIALWNLVVDVFVLIYNLIAEVANFIGNVFTDPIGAVCRLFFGLADTVLGILQALASAIDAIFGSNLAGSVQGWRDSLGGWVEDTFGKGEEIMAKMSADDMKLGRFEYGAAWDAGYSFGEGIDESISNFDPSSLFDTEVPGADAYTGLGGAGIGDDISDIAGNTAAIKDSVDISEEDLKYMRDLAEAEAINRYTTAEITINQENHNNISSNMDLDGVVDGLTSGLQEAADIATEGVHN